MTVPNASVTPAGYTTDPITASELDLFAENTSELYGQFQSIIASVKRRIKNGTYDPTRSPALWLYWYDAAARRYSKEFGMDSAQDARNIFPYSIRLELATQRAADEYTRILSGEYD